MKNIRSLDGLRALAILPVIASHAGYAFNATAGVTLFFVISGYLITKQLVEELESSRKINFANFYIRRFARLYPAIVLVCTFTCLWLWSSGLPTNKWWMGPIGMLTFTIDLIQHFLGLNAISTYFQYNWSLGIEEQYYIIWPIIVLLSYRITKKFALAGFLLVLALQPHGL